MTEGTARAVRPRPRRFDPFGAVLFLACLVPLALIVAKLLRDELGANPIEKVELETGRWALRFLAITLAITPIRRISGANKLAKYRRMLGLFTFSYATIHLLTYVGLDMVFDVSDIVEDVAEHLYVTVGLLTWLILLPLAITSTRGWQRRLGARWQRLHRLTYVAAVTGTVHYLWAVKKDTFLPLVYLTIFIVLLGWRAAGWLARRRAAVSASARGGPPSRAPSPQES